MRDWLADCKTYTGTCMHIHIRSHTHIHIQQQLVAHTSAVPAERDSVLASLALVGGGQAACMCVYICTSSLTRA